MNSDGSPEGPPGKRENVLFHKIEAACPAFVFVNEVRSLLTICDLVPPKVLILPEFHYAYGYLAG